MDEIAVKFAIAKTLRSEVQDLNKGTNELTEIYKLMEEQLRLHVVSQQREQLKAYAELIQKDYTNHFFDDAVEESIDQFLSL